MEQEMGYVLGAKVIVTTCRGEFRGTIKSIDRSFAGGTIYEITGDEIETKTSARSLRPDVWQKLDRSSHCPKCKEPCFWREETKE